ncbi:hypothetical protein PAXRUDRAFT_178002, partial [Paxillus rubicundulus Ve08.2h10]
CLWQLNIAEAFLKGNCDISWKSLPSYSFVKTLSFWFPLLLVFWPLGIQIVVIPLNQLGQQNIDLLAKAGIRRIAINAETVTWEKFLSKFQWF